MPDSDQVVVFEPRPRRDAGDILLASAVFDSLRDAVSALKAAGDHSMTLASEVRAAIDDRVHRLRRERNAGQPFPARTQDPPRGRPLGVKKER